MLITCKCCADIPLPLNNIIISCGQATHIDYCRWKWIYCPWLNWYLFHPKTHCGFNNNAGVHLNSAHWNHWVHNLNSDFIINALNTQYITLHSLSTLRWYVVVRRMVGLPYENSIRVVNILPVALPGHQQRWYLTWVQLYSDFNYRTIKLLLIYSLEHQTTWININTYAVILY